MATPVTRPLRQIAPDLWETPRDAPAPGLTTHAYRGTPPSRPNVRFCSVATDAHLAALAHEVAPGTRGACVQEAQEGLTA